MAREEINRKHVNVRIGDALMKRVDRLRLPYGMTVTQVIVQALAEYVERQEQMRGVQPAEQHKPRR